MDRSWYHAILLLIAVVMGSVLTLNLLVALFVESYTKEMISVRQVFATLRPHVNSP
jgi:hypothetical protein